MLFVAPTSGKNSQSHYCAVELKIFCFLTSIDLSIYDRSVKFEKCRLLGFLCLLFPFCPSFSSMLKILMFSLVYASNLNVATFQHQKVTLKGMNIFCVLLPDGAYSCMTNIESTVSNLNITQISKTSKPPEARKSNCNCNCQNKYSCPMDGRCNRSNIIYQAEVTTSQSRETSIRLCDTTFKLQYYNL